MASRNNEYEVTLGLDARQLKLASKHGLSSAEVEDLCILEAIEGVYLRLCEIRHTKPGYVNWDTLRVTFDSSHRLKTKPFTLNWCSVRRAALKWKQRKLTHGLVGGIQWGTKYVKGMALETEGA